MPEVYLLTCRVTGKRYVGIAKGTATRRFKEHCKAARNGSQVFLHRAIRKYGASFFDVTVLKTVVIWDEAKKLERIYIDIYGTFNPNGFNMTKGGEGTIDYHHTESARAAMSRKHKSKVFSAETRQRMSDANRGKPKSPEHAAKIRAALARQLPYSPERLARMQSARVNGPLSEEHKIKIGNTLRGRTQDPVVVAARIPLVRAAMTVAGVREKIIASNKRRIVTPETRQKMSVSLKAMLARPEVKPKLTARNKARVWTKEARAKIGAAHRGKPKSAEQRERMRQAGIIAWSRRRRSASLPASTESGST